jgi:hypothetical protein
MQAEQVGFVEVESSGKRGKRRLDSRNQIQRVSSGVLSTAG